MVIWPTWWIFFFLNHASYHFLQEKTPWTLTSFRSHENSLRWQIHLPWYLYFCKNPNQPSVFFISTNWPTDQQASTSPRLRANVPNPKIRCTELPESDLSSDEGWPKKGLEGGNENSKVQFCMKQIPKNMRIHQKLSYIRCLFSNAIRQFRILCVHSCSTTRALGYFTLQRTIFKHLRQMEHQNL